MPYVGCVERPGKLITFPASAGDVGITSLMFLGFVSLIVTFTSSADDTHCTPSIVFAGLFMAEFEGITSADQYSKKILRGHLKTVYRL